MFFLILMIVLISSASIFFLKRDKKTLWILGLCLSYMLMFVGISIYLAKTGGLNPEQEFFLFLNKAIKRKLSYLVLSPQKLGYIIAVGRSLFPGFLMLVALEYSMVPVIMRNKRRHIWALALPLLNLLLYFPPVYLGLLGRFTRLWQRALFSFTLVWVAAYLCLALFLLGCEYKSITMSYCKRQFASISIFLLCISVMYGLYFLQDPIQVYQTYSAAYLRFGGLLYSSTPIGSVRGWIILSVLTALFGFLGFWSLRSYSVIEYADVHGDIAIQKKMKSAGNSLSVIVHAMKNQLLANRVLQEKMAQTLEGADPEKEKLLSYLAMLEQINGSMLRRMDELYRSIRSEHMTLAPLESGQIARQAIEELAEKYPEARVELLEEGGGLMLADAMHMREVLYNLLANGYEGSQGLPEERRGLELQILCERLYISFAVRDRGRGIAKNMQKKIFEPFYTSKNTNQNWGLGLYYVRQIVKNHFGLLRMESQEGVGTTFFVAIPRYGYQGK